MCKPSPFHDAFEKALRTADFQKAQLTVALATYERRLKNFASLGLRSEYGNVAMAVIGNNLIDTPECQPKTWKAACAGRADEKSTVDCMLELYEKNACRGSESGSEDRVEAIKLAFHSTSDTGLVHPFPDAVIACSANWGQ